MDEGYSKSIIVKLGIAILVIALIDLFFLNWWVYKKQEQQSAAEASQLDEARDINVIEPTRLVTSPSPSSEPQLEDSKTKTIIEKETTTVVQTAQKEIFIPVGSGSLKSTVWIDIPGLEVNVDRNKYSEIESIIFEATIWPEGGNGKAYARLKNVTDNNPLTESIISSASVSGELKSSGNIPFPAGSKKYGVQVKSDIENFPAHVENARIKITLK